MSNREAFCNAEKVLDRFRCGGGLWTPGSLRRSLRPLVGSPFPPSWYLQRLGLSVSTSCLPGDATDRLGRLILVAYSTHDVHLRIGYIIRISRLWTEAVSLLLYLNPLRQLDRSLRLNLTASIGAGCWRDCRLVACVAVVLNCSNLSTV